MRKKAPSQKMPCVKQNCCGVSNEHQNFLSVTSRGNTRSHSKNNSKKKSKRTKKKESAIKQILQETYSHLRQQNQELIKKLNIKKRKMDEMKTRIKEMEDEIKRYQQLQKKRVEGQEYKSDRQKKANKQIQQEKNQTKMIQDWQIFAKQAQQRYQKLEDEYSKYRQSTERKIDKMMSHRLTTEGAQKNYNKQIQLLKQELTRFKQEHMTATSLKNLHQSNTIEQKLRLQISTLKASNSNLRSETSKLQQYIKQLEEELEQRTANAQHKERQLKSNLDVINSKINEWEKDYQMVKQESMNWQREYNTLLDKYQRKKHKYKVNNAEWAQIFKQFIYEIDKLKQELDSVSERNVKLIKLYGHH